MFNFKKKQQLESVEVSCQVAALPPESMYDEKDNVVVRLVSHRKNKKPYQITGIEDVSAKNNWKAWLYLGPVIVLIAVFLIYPLINTIFIAFTENYQYASGTFDGFTINNFGVILGLTPVSTGGTESNFTRYAILNTFIIVFVTVPCSTALALIISVALNSIKWFQKVLQTIFFLPYVTNAIAIGMVFAVIFDTDYGIFNAIFGTAHHPWITPSPQFPDNPVNYWSGVFAICFYIIWSSLPYKILIFLGGLQNVDKQYYEAAQIDATPKWKTIWKITIPLFSPKIMYVMVT